MDLSRSRVKAEALGQNCGDRVWVHTNGDNKRVIVSDMESEKPNAEENGGKCNQISSTPKFLTLPNMLTLGRVAAVPLLIAGESEPFVDNFQRKLLPLVLAFSFI